MSLQKPLRLFWKENYSRKPQAVQDAIEKAVKESVSTINLYPATLYDEVIDLIAKKLHIKHEQIILGHGIEGLLHLTSQSILTSQSSAGMFQPSFFGFTNNVNRYKAVKYPVEHNAKVDVSNLLEKIKDVDIFYMASPNTATGNYLLSREEIKYMLQSFKGILGVDECYFGIGDQSVVDLVDSYGNLIVYRGVTKVMGMPSIRLGIAIAQEEIIKKLQYNQNDIEYDPITTFSLNIFKETFPYFDELAKNTNEFEDKFLSFMRSKFPETTFTKTLVTYHFMDIQPYKKQAFEIINFMNEKGFIMSANPLTDNSSLNFSEFLEISPPPEEYWEEFGNTLKEALC